MNLFRTLTTSSLQSRILALFLLLMVIVQVGGFILINTVGMAAARKTVGEALVAAEGVEDDGTLDRLHAMGCDMVQGYLLSRPMGVAETAVWMRGSVWTKPASEPPSLRRVV